MFRMLLFLTCRFYDLIYRQISLQKQSLNLFRTAMAMAVSIVDIFQNVNNICITFVILKQRSSLAYLSFTLFNKSCCFPRIDIARK